MNGRNIVLTGKELVVFALRLSIPILVLCCVIGIMSGCEQVSSDTAMQCFGCIQALQKAISSALQEAEAARGAQTSLKNNGEKSLSQLSIEDLTILDRMLQELTSLETLQELSQSGIMTSYSAYDIKKQAEREVKEGKEAQIGQ